MTELATIETASPAPAATGGTRMTQYVRAFAGLFLRDLHVLRREMFPFVIRVCMNPLLFLFVFTFIMPHMSGGAAMNPTAAAMGQNFGITREIDDRVICPLPVAAVAMEKIFFSAMQSIIAAVLVLHEGHHT